MEDPNVSFTVQLTTKDLFRANLWFLRRTSRMSLALLTLTAAAILWVWVARGRVYQRIFPYLVIVLLWAGWWFVWTYFHSRSQFKKQTPLQHANHYTISPKGLDIESDLQSTHMDWSEIHQARENRAYIFLYLSERTGLVVPKRALPDRETAERLREILTANVHGKVRLAEWWLRR